MNDERLFASYRQEYYHQIGVIDSLVSKARALLGFLVLLVGLTPLAFRDLTVPLDSYETLVASLLAASSVPLAVAAYYLVRALVGQPYRYIPLLTDLEAYPPEQNVKRLFRVSCGI